VYGRIPTASVARHATKNRTARYCSLILEGGKLTKNAVKMKMTASGGRR
jgi:hypothetical protein